MSEYVRRNEVDWRTAAYIVALARLATVCGACLANHGKAVERLGAIPIGLGSAKVSTDFDGNSVLALFVITILITSVCAASPRQPHDLHAK